MVKIKYMYQIQRIDKKKNVPQTGFEISILSTITTPLSHCAMDTTTLTLVVISHYVLNVTCPEQINKTVKFVLL